MKAPETAAAQLEERPPSRVSRRTWRKVVTWSRAADWALEGVSVGLVVVVAVGFGSFAGRRALVGELAEEYLRRRGVESVIEVYDVDARGFIGRVRLGPADDPDFTAERVQVLLASPPPPEGPYALRPRSILISQPRLKARWTGERLSFGALDPLVEEALSRPPDPDRPSPRVSVVDGALRLATPYGLVRASGDGVVDDSRLERLGLELRPATLEGEGFAAELRGGTVGLRVRENVADLRLNLLLAEFRSGDAGLEEAVLRLDGRAPYPDTAARRLDGPVRLTAALSAAGATAGQAALSTLETNIALRGSVAGPLSQLVYTGGADLFGRAGTLRTAAGEGREVRLGARLADVRLAQAADGLDGRGVLRASLKARRAAAGNVWIGAPSLDLSSDALSIALRPEGSTAWGPTRLTLTADRLVSGELSARTLQLAADSPGASLRAGSGGLVASGPLRANFSARSAALRGTGGASGLRARFGSTLNLLTGGAAQLQGSASLDRLQLVSTPLTASDAVLRFSGRAGQGGLSLAGDLQGRGALPPRDAGRIAAGLPVLGEEAAYAAAIGGALQAFDLDAPGLRLTHGPGRTRLLLTEPIRVRGRGGALAELTPVGGAFVPLGGGSQGGLRLAVGGGGLPDITATVDRYRVDSGGFDADLRIRAALDAAIARGATVEARGRASSRHRRFTFTAAECVRFTAARVELGENDLDGLSARLCPEPQAELIRTAGSGFRVRGRFEQASALVPFLQARLSGGRGALDVSGGASGLTSVAARIAAAEVTDAAAERRFHPVALTGTAALANGRWAADLDILDAPGGVRLANADLAHDAAAGRGGVTVTVDDLRFTPDGLQPHDLSPMAVGLVSELDGAVDFQGVLDWTEAGVTSRGRVSTDGLSFDSPAGRVVGLRRELVLSSLAPLTAPAGQNLTAERIETFSPLTEVTATLGVTAAGLELATAAAGFSGGRLTLEPLTVPLAGDRKLAGAVRLENVDLGALIERTGFADKVSLQAVVDGRLPFQTGPDGLRFAGGELRSDRPGRLSISREALTDVEGQGGPSAAPAEGEGAPASTAEGRPAEPPNAFQDFAYQALENLAYDQLSVAVDSRPGGRLGLVFVVDGRHDPPNPQQARIGLFDLLRGRAFQRRIPLPKGAPVNLTLDSSINFDELLATYMDLQRARNLERSAPVQAAPAKSGSE